jgi:Domain of unknown function (DUF6379)
MKKSGVMTAKVIGDGGIVATPTGFRIDIRLPWYRSLPVSTVEIDSVAIDEIPVDRANVTFELENRSIALSAMPDEVETVWYVLDSAYLNVKSKRLEPGAAHEFSVTMSLYPPYIRGLRRMIQDREVLRA